MSLNWPHEPRQRARRLRQALARALLQGHGRGEAHLDLRDGAEEHREADDRDGARQGGGQPVARRRNARRHPQYAAQEDAAAADQRVVAAKVARALLSVSDKSGIVELARGLAALGIELISTGGTAKLLAKEGLKVTEVSAHTGFPEMLDGRVKTLHPKIHGGLLARRALPAHLAAMKEHGIAPIDLLAVNLYPFEATVAQPGCTLDDASENIDIGGPAMVRSAAKNWKDVAVLTDASQYAGVLAELKASG